MNIKHIHLDAVGGVAGDMFVAAFLDFRPDLIKECSLALDMMGLSKQGKIAVESHNDAVLTGVRFKVDELNSENPAAHKHWSEIRALIINAGLSKKVEKIALEIFRLLASAEAEVHGIKLGEVAFHEVGAFDSLVDIICASVIIATFENCSWSIGPMPRGSGLVKSQHGFLPVPAPAATILLEGFLLVQDEDEGERVTPTGAAIIRYLNPSQKPNEAPQILVGSGIGFGSRKLKLRSNILRITAYAGMGGNKEPGSVEVLRCEIDDQTAEDLALATEVIRNHEGVIDVCQWPVFGKKGRIAFALQILVKLGYTDKISEILFDETTTLGIRYMHNQRKVISREEKEIDGVNVKLAFRPSGVSAKADVDAFTGVAGQARRSAQKKQIERKAKKGRAEDVN